MDDAVELKINSSESELCCCVNLSEVLGTVEEVGFCITSIVFNRLPRELKCSTIDESVRRYDDCRIELLFTIILECEACFSRSCELLSLVFNCSTSCELLVLDDIATLNLEGECFRY